MLLRLVHQNRYIILRHHFGLTNYKFSWNSSLRLVNMSPILLDNTLISAESTKLTNMSSTGRGPTPTLAYWRSKWKKAVIAEELDIAPSSVAYLLEKYWPVFRSSVRKLRKPMDPKNLSQNCTAHKETAIPGDFCKQRYTQASANEAETAPYYLAQGRASRVGEKNVEEEWGALAECLFLRREKFNLDGPNGYKYWHDLRKEGQYYSKRWGCGASVMV